MSPRQRQFGRGTYTTRGGRHAVVAQVRELREEGKLPRWVLRGAIELDGILVPTAWDIQGKSLSGEAKYDLMKAKDDAS